MERREFTKVAALAGAGLLVAPVAWASGSTSGRPEGVATSNETLTVEDEHFLKIISELGALPEDLKQKAPVQGGDDEVRLTPQIDGLKRARSSLRCSWVLRG